MELLGTYPRGEVLCSTHTPDGSRLFVADGASLAVLDTTTLPPQLYPQNLIDSIELSDVPGNPTLPLADDNPDPTPNQMLFHRSSLAQGSVFIAGGTGGMFRLDLGRGYFESGFPQTHTLTVLETPATTKGQLGDPATYRWKRCVDVAFVEQGSRKLVFGLFASSQRYGGMALFGGVELGATELIAWEFTGDGPATYYGRYAFDSVTAPPGPGALDNVIGTALATDPGDTNHLYVALGVQWLWRVDISSVSAGQFPGSAQITLNPSPVPCNGSACPAGERMRDLAIVRQTVAGGTRALAYAAFEYGRLLEIELLPTTQVQGSVLTTFAPPCGFGERVSAVAHGSTVLVAYGLSARHSLYQDTAAPYRPTGIWSDPCILVGLADPNDLFALGCGSAKIRILRRTATAGLTGVGLTGDLVGPDEAIATIDYWGSLALRHVFGGFYHLYEATSAGDFTLHELSALSQSDAPAAPGPTTPPPRFVTTLTDYAGPGIAPGDGTVPEGDDTLAYFGGELFGRHPRIGSMVRVTNTGSVWDLEPIPNTISVCPARAEPFPTSHCPNPAPGYQGQAAGDPNPFVGGILGSANWVDPWTGVEPDVPAHPYRLWLVGGSRTWRLTGLDGCDAPGGPNCFVDPCSLPVGTPIPKWRHTWLPSFDSVPVGQLDDQTRSGWKFTLLDPLHPTGLTMDMRWWQLASPTDFPSAKIQAVDLLSSTNDPRFDIVGANMVKVPRLIHATRSGSEVGYKVFSPYAFMHKAENVCSASSSEDLGRGQELTPEPVVAGKPAYYEVRTHIELENGAGPMGTDALCITLIPNSTCQFAPDGNKATYDIRTDTFALETATMGTRYVTAVACGTIVTGPGSIMEPQVPGCPWEGDVGKFLVTFYDVTDTPGDSDGLSAVGPSLLRVAVGPPLSNAFAVKAKSYDDGTTLVFVADLLGRVFTLDVSGDVLFTPAATTPYRSSNCIPNCTPVLSVLTGASEELLLASDPVDGRPANVLDLELDGNDLYLALGRGGIAVLDVSRPGGVLDLSLRACIDTPGLAQGLALRGTGAGRQLIVGDSRAGMRLYGRTGTTNESQD